MPARSKVLSLPANVKAELDRRLVDGGFQDYEGLSAFLAEQGFEVSASAVHRYGQSFEKQVQALKVASGQAQVAVEALGDDEDALGQALTGIAKQKLLNLLIDFEMDAEAVDLKELTLAISRVTNSGVRVKQMAAQVRERASSTADEVDDVVRAAGLSDGAAADIRAKILGIAP